MNVRTPYYHIVMGDKNIKTAGGVDITPWVSSVSVVEDDRQADNVSLAVPDPRMIYADAMFEGSYVEVDIGYNDVGQHALVLRAMITKVEMSYPQDGLPSMTLKGEDKSILMGLVEKKKVWRDRTITDIVHEIGTQNGFAKVEARLNPDPPAKRPINQDGKTDLAFLQDLAKEHHAKCFVELDEAGEEVLYFIPERAIVKLRRPEQLLLSYRGGPQSNLISFSPSFSTSYIDRLKEVNDVDHRGNRIQSQQREQTEIVAWPLDETLLAQANARDLPRIRTLYAQGSASKQELQAQLAKRRQAVGHVAQDQADIEATNDALESRRLGMTASGSTHGNIWLRAKSNVTVTGANSRFNGDWYVTSVTHKLDSNGYKTDFKCVR
ncbi:MAG TPA: contractile injection system protein, VgrG/Pvc8 family [Pyrinomonadaceae bacterium]|jgi:phage protein D